MVNKLTTNVATAEETERDHCEVCDKPLDQCYNVITFTVDCARALSVFRFTFKKHYRYCSMAHAAKFYESFPYLGEKYVTVTAGAPLTITETSAEML